MKYCKHNKVTKATGFLHDLSLKLIIMALVFAVGGSCVDKKRDLTSPNHGHKLNGNKSGVKEFVTYNRYISLCPVSLMIIRCETVASTNLQVSLCQTERMQEEKATTYIELSGLLGK